jgi:RNA-directed DNA polymerase
MISVSNPQSTTDLFNRIETVPDYVKLLNEVYAFIYKSNDTPFNLPALNYYAFHCQHRYNSFNVLKKNGGTRTINAPNAYLKLVQRCTNFILQRQFRAHHTAHGFLVDRSIVTNARRHIGKRFVLNVDIENFFGSISFRRIKTVLALEPFNLNKVKEPLGFLISNLCCNEGVLPQGGPCSPILTNAVCQRLDRKLFQLAKSNHAVYSRYADDITFSSDSEIFTALFIDQIGKIIKSEGFDLNKSKTRIQNSAQKQVVTGITVNRKLNVDRNFVRNIRAILNNFHKYGYEYTQSRFEANWKNPNNAPPSFVNSVCGQIEFLGMVRGKRDHIYIRYRNRFLDLFDEPADFGFILNDNVRFQLEKDYSKMKRIKSDLNLSDEERFTDYCINAFFQIEELINHYFTKAMPFKKLCTELISNTLINKGLLKNKRNVGSIEMAYKIYLFEKYFYYGKGSYYDSIITKIRLVRNEGLHRCSSIIRDEEQLLKDHRALESKIKAYGQEYKLSREEKHLEQEVKLIPFLKARDYEAVKDTVLDVALKIKLSFEKMN